MTDILIRGGRIIDPATGLDQTGDLLLRDGLITKTGTAPAKDTEIIAADGLVVSPGFVDLHTHLREPGDEEKETIASGTLAAARGGYTSVCCMPNTSPPLDDAVAIEFITEKARQTGLVRVLPVGCISRGRQGKEITEMAGLLRAGAVAVSDDGLPALTAELVQHALEYAGALGLPLMEHCEDVTLTRGAQINEGNIATRLGLKGWPAAAEEIILARDAALAALTGGKLHVCHVSTAGAVEIIRRAKDRGVNITAEVTPHHLTLTETAVLGYDTQAKVNPPLRTQADADALIAGLTDGTLDAVATDHAPHLPAEKICEFDLAPFGIIGLETALGSLMSLVHGGQLPLPTLISKLTAEPARIIGGGYGTLAAGAAADVTIFDPDFSWTVDPEAFASKGRTTPLTGQTLRGRVMLTIYSGQTVHRDAAFGDGA